MGQSPNPLVNSNTIILHQRSESVNMFQADSNKESCLFFYGKRRMDKYNERLRYQQVQEVDATHVRKCIRWW